MSNNVIEMKIEDILKLSHDTEEVVYNLGDLYIFNMLHNLYDEFSDKKFEAMSNLKQRSYVKDYCNDCRSRDLNILFYKDKPFAMYQYIGRGNTENEEIFDKEVYSDFIKDYLLEYLDKSHFSKQYSQVCDVYTIKNYNMAYFEISDNQICAKNYK